MPRFRRRELAKAVEWDGRSLGAVYSALLEWGYPVTLQLTVPTHGSPLPDLHVSDVGDLVPGDWLVVEDTDRVLRPWSADSFAEKWGSL